MAVLFVVFVLMVFMGQKHVGLSGLAVELVGLFGIVGLLYVYNRRYK